jgi:hypothetical protein
MTQPARRVNSTFTPGSGCLFVLPFDPEHGGRSPSKLKEGYITLIGIDIRTKSHNEAQKNTSNILVLKRNVYLNVFISKFWTSLLCSSPHSIVTAFYFANLHKKRFGIAQSV